MYLRFWILILAIDFAMQFKIGEDEEDEPLDKSYRPPITDCSVDKQPLKTSNVSSI